MESDNLKTASLYINNQLLSRGLLRNGQTIEFARPEKDPGGVEGTMGRIMSVVNDLILRRDRDATQRESLAQTVRALRADALRQTTELERVTTKHTESQRKLGLADASERALKMQIRSAEQAARGMKEEMGRMKLLVGQTRAQCANEVRKRDRVIEGMKKHVTEGARPRGSGKAPGVTTITVTAGVGAEIGNSRAVATDDTGYDLRMETNEFLTELARGLSEENESLLGLVRRTVRTLQTISGCEKDGTQEEGMVVQEESAYENLALEMDEVIEHLRHLLTNPSFVPLEEVEIREEEIIRLREGWEKMEGRWREAVQLMDGWRKRMARSGQTVNLDELKLGLSLSPIRVEETERKYELSTLEEEEGEGDTQADIDAMDDSGIPPPEPELDVEDYDSESSLFEEEPIEEEVSEEVTEESPVDERQEEEFSLNTVSSMSPGPPPQLSPLREIQGNRGPSDPKQSCFTTIVEENTLELLNLEKSSSAVKPKLSTPKSQRRKPSSQLSVCSSDEISLLKTSSKSSPLKISNPSISSLSTPRLQMNSSSRLPRPRENLAPQQSPLTMASIAAKLAATEREADAARVRAKIKAAKLSRAKPTKGTPSSEATKLKPPPRRQETEEIEPTKEGATTTKPEGNNEKEAPSARKRKASGRGQGGRASRRRSTLSPWELESLILGKIDGSPAK